jgi:pyruvate dehydrogenase E2 component (dihydrolipoamide acetyltransferase)
MGACSIASKKRKAGKQAVAIWKNYIIIEATSIRFAPEGFFVPIPVSIPRLGWSMEEGVFAGWLKHDGELVRPGDRLFTLESDKATEDVEALDGGILAIPAEGPRPGDTVRVGQEIGLLLQPGEVAPEKAASVSGSTHEAPASPSIRRLARARGVELNQRTGTGPAGRITSADVQRRAAGRRAVAPLAAVPAISPRALRIAGELGVDWAQLRGSGTSGRIRECDVRAAAAGPAKPPAATIPPAASDKQRQRQRIAEHLTESVRTTVPVTLTTTADATNLVNLRGQFQAVAAGAPVPGYTDFLVKLAAVALQRHPDLNARWEDGAVVLEQAIRIGIAVDTEAGLLVPVVREVAALSVRQLAAHTRDLVERARQRRLCAEEMQGGTFTVSNLGGFGIDAFTPIIPVGQCAILGMGRIQRVPAVVNDQVTVRDRITLSLTFDHRIVDGAPAARFLQTLAGLVENPGPALVA